MGVPTFPNPPKRKRDMSTFEQSRYIYHKVQKDDTFEKLAERYGSNVPLLRRIYREHFEGFAAQPKVGEVITIPIPDVLV